ncbi:MAG: family 78 glycoside hydrolase catalytic domain, partial [Thermoguttaceae bacterium]|nr:family 78 glycoside hydrolase catalytic domain [Thermoguttaceae bacterium]
TAFDNQEVWDSGKVESDQQTFVPYTGDDLAPATEYMVELTIWNSDGSRKSQIYSCFSTGLYPTADNPNPWKGDWIGFSEPVQEKPTADISKAYWIGFIQKDGCNLPVGKSVYRKSFEVQDINKLTAAFANISGDNSYALYLNGQKIANNSGFQTAYYIDLKSDALQSGINTLAIELDNAGTNENPGGLIGAFTLIYENGEKTEFVTDESWKCSEGTNEAWFAADFNDSNWANAELLVPWGKGPWGEIEAVQPDQNSIPARYLSRKFELEDKEIVRAVSYICGAGYYELYFNGQRVGNHLLDPIYTEFDKRIAYNTYDVTDHLKGIQWNREHYAFCYPATPSIGIILGSGRFYGPRHSPHMNTKTYGDPRVLFQLEIEYADGSRQIVTSDKDWKVSTSGPIVENNDYDGEICDARKAIHGVVDFNKYENVFVENTFDAASSYAVPTEQDVEIMDAPKGELVAQMMPPMRNTGELKPISMNEVRPGVWVYDFGQNFVGWCRLKVKGEAGTKVQMRFAETLLQEGENAGMLYVDNLRGAKCRDIYILAGKKNGEVYEPRFTQHGFRFVELTGFPGTPDLDTLTGCIVSTDLPITGFFKCSDPTISQFHSNIQWGTRGNYLSMPTDCPQRDERQGWQGDRAAESKGEMFLFDNITLYRKWMQD